MQIIKAIIAWFGMVLTGMFGGQKNKAVRRFGFAAFAEGYCLSVGWEWRYLAFLGFIPVMIMGYGVNSGLGAAVGHVEWLIRGVYAFLLSGPFLVFGLMRWGAAAILLIIAFQIHAGSLGHTSWFGDFLIEDICRYGVLGALVIFNVSWKRK